IDGNPEPSPAYATVASFLRCHPANTILRWIPSKKGLTRQRNIGLEAATGSILCFLDDDVTLPSNFLEQVSHILAQPGFEEVGGITGSDLVNSSLPMTRRWRLRRAFGVIPDLPPGGVDRLGRGIPLSFLEPFSGFKDVSLLPGFCMIYRRSIIGDLRFDELIP